MWTVAKMRRKRGMATRLLWAGKAMWRRWGERQGVRGRQGERERWEERQVRGRKK
jgi:hypothetical protein